MVSGQLWMKLLSGVKLKGDAERSTSNQERLLVNLINFLAGWRLLNKSGKRSFSSDKLAKDVIA